ncbi:ACT domain-containing protein [Nanoarchaeota archaeon]|nr:MAG: ACT domain-containing protein [Nanoarchaeota archaeon]
MRPEDYFKNGKVYVWKEKFSIVKSKRPIRDAFAVIRDKNEITVIAEESKIDPEDVIEREDDWRIITFDMVLPFELVGFLAKVSQALAEEGISIFAVSAYSTDHILVKEEDLKKAVKKLEELGCVVEE